MKGTGEKRNVFPGSCVSTGAKFPVAPVESAPMAASSPDELVTPAESILKPRFRRDALSPADKLNLEGVVSPNEMF